MKEHMATKQIVSNNPMEFCEELVKAASEGWSIDESEHFSMFHTLFCIGMKKDESMYTSIEKKSLGRPKADKVTQNI